MKYIFAKSYIHCYLKLMGSDFTFLVMKIFGDKSYHYLTLEK